MVNKASSSSKDVVLRLGLVKNAFIICKTPPKPWHDLIISPPIKNNLPMIFLPQKKFFSPHENHFLEKHPFIF